MEAFDPRRDAADDAESSSPGPKRRAALGGASGDREAFEAALLDVRVAAQEFGVQHDQTDGRFVSALLTSIQWTGRLNLGVQAALKELAVESRAALATEVAAVRELGQAVRIQLQQSRNAQIALEAERLNFEIERDTLIAKMIDGVLPQFAERLQDVLVIRETRWNEDRRRRAIGMTVAAALTIFGVGYGLSSYQSWTASGSWQACMSHLMVSDKSRHVYCDVTDYVSAPSGSAAGPTPNAGTSAAK